MPSVPTRRLALVLLLAMSGALASAEDWPEFRGPTGQGHSAERDLLLAWSEWRNVLWKTPVPGIGWSSPVVAAGRVWVTSAIAEGSGSPRALAFDFDTGREVVNAEIFRMTDVRAPNPKNSLASPTPIVEGDRVYVHFGAYGTAALTTAGDIVWSTRFPYQSEHGNGGSPRPLRGPPHFQLRWLRHSVRRRARQADWTSPLENAAPPTLLSGILNPARDPGGRPERSRQRRSVSRGCL